MYKISKKHGYDTKSQHFWPNPMPEFLTQQSQDEEIHPTPRTIHLVYPSLNPSDRNGPLPGDLEVPRGSGICTGTTWSESPAFYIFPGWFLGFFLVDIRKSLLFWLGCFDRGREPHFVAAHLQRFDRQRLQRSLAAFATLRRWCRERHSLAALASFRRRGRREPRHVDGHAAYLQGLLGFRCDFFQSSDISVLDGFGWFSVNRWPLFEKNQVQGSADHSCCLQSQTLPSWIHWFGPQAMVEASSSQMGRGDRVLRVWVVWSSVLWADKNIKKQYMMNKHVIMWYVFIWHE